MSGEVKMGGGFGGVVRSQMSPGLLRQIAQQEEQEARQAAEELRRREAKAEAWQARAVQAAIADAMEAGEQFSPRMLEGRGLGHTPSEFVALVSARQDHEDMVAAAQERREFEQWQVQHNADLSASTSEIEAEAARAKEWQEEMRPRLEARRQKKKDEARLLRIARRRAQWDRGLR